MVHVFTLKLHGPMLQPIDSVSKVRHNNCGKVPLHCCVRTIVPLLQDAEQDDQELQLPVVKNRFLFKINIVLNIKLNILKIHTAILNLKAIYHTLHIYVTYQKL